MKIGITGATGFIGRNLIDKILANGHAVKALVMEDHPSLPSSVECVYGNLVEDLNIDNFLKGCDVILHLAGKFTLPEEDMMKVNVMGTYNLIKNDAIKKISHIIFISSIAVYGNNRINNFKESDPCAPDTVYGLSKYLAEEVLRLWKQKNNGSLTILRPFNIYGPGNRQGIVYSLYRSVLENGEVVVYGDGTNERSYVYIDDLVDAFIKIIDNNVEGVFNIGSSEKYSVLNLLDQIKSVTHKDFKVAHDNKQSAQVYNIGQDLSLVEKELGWKAKTSIKEGLKKTIDWFSKNN